MKVLIFTSVLSTLCLLLWLYDFHLLSHEHTAFLLVNEKRVGRKGERGGESVCIDCKEASRLRSVPLHPSSLPYFFFFQMEGCYETPVNKTVSLEKLTECIHEVLKVKIIVGK